VKYWHRLLGEAVESPSLVVLKNNKCGDVALRDMVRGHGGGHGLRLNCMIVLFFSNFNNSMIFEAFGSVLRQFWFQVSHIV